jgi:hypothetical protein
VGLLDAGARAGLTVNEYARRSGPAGIAKVLIAIDGLCRGRWRRPGRDVQPGKMPLKGLPEDAKKSTLVTAVRCENPAAHPWMNAHAPRQLSGTAIIHAGDSVACRNQTVKPSRQANSF